MYTCSAIVCNRKETIKPACTLPAVELAASLAVTAADQKMDSRWLSILGVRFIPFIVGSRNLSIPLSWLSYREEK